jgi:hypothetical protein
MGKHKKHNSENEMVNHPNHYQFGDDKNYEVIKIIEIYQFDFHLGNCFKYISRAGKKNPEKEIEDLKKARFYLDRKIEFLENNQL